MPPRIYTPETLAKIPDMVESGMSTRDIAREIGSHTSSLKVTCAKNNIKLRRTRQHPEMAFLRPKTRHALNRQAFLSGCTQTQLIGRLLDAIVDDNLFSAVLET